MRINRGHLSVQLAKRVAPAMLAAAACLLTIASASAAGFVGVSDGGAFPGRVIHVRDTRATSWDYKTGWYGDYVDQNVVSTMVDQGLMALTGTGSRLEAWRALIPGFKPSKKIAIKVNFNNAESGDPGNAIDALIEPVNAVIGGLIELGFDPLNISVYDVSHGMHDGVMPQRFIDGCDYPHVDFVGYSENPEPYSDTTFVHFNPPSEGPAITDRPLANVALKADYLIDMPIAKVHDYAGVSLGFKNHFGSIDRCDLLHDYVMLKSQHFTSEYNPLVDLYRDRHIGGKTVLTVCDGLFGNWEHLWTPPSPWKSFANGAPNSIFLATDPVALDCVVIDVLAQETMIPETADDYLWLASNAGLGVFERAISPGKYALINYVRLEGPFVATGAE